MEDIYVKNTYNQIADHFNDTRKGIWTCVKKFLDNIPSNSIIADIGCGNGKYIRYRNDIFVIANDICLPLLETSLPMKSHYDIVEANGLNLPYRNNLFQYAISIAVLHHLSSEDLRIKFINNILNILEVNGKLLFTVWAAEQNIKDKYINQGNNDYLIPWLDKNSKKTFYRYYHLFSEYEIINLIKKIDCKLESIEYERDNWCVVLIKK